MARPTHEQFKKQALADPKVKKAYDDLEEEFELIAENQHRYRLLNNDEDKDKPA